MLIMHNFNQNFYSDITRLGNAELYLDDVIENIDQVKFFQSFNEAELRVLTKYLDCYGAPRNYTLFEEGYASNYLIIMLSGEANLQSMNAESQTLSFGATVGGISLVEPSLWEGTCVTSKPTDIAVLTKNGLNEILMHHPRLGNKVLLTIIDLMTVQYKQSVMKYSKTQGTVAH